MTLSEKKEQSGGSMLVGYARVSTEEQNLNLQRDALAQVGCEQIFSDEMSGAKSERPGLSAALSFVRSGDTLVVWRLDRLGRSLKDLIARVEELKQRGIGFRSLHESIDTASPSGKLQFHIFSALAEFERDLIRERTLAGLTAARARGRVGGRRRSMTPEKVKLAARLMQDPAVSVAEICHTLRVSRATLYRHVSPNGEVRQPPI
jgi:DNA invertase Pin-like site-specific DNA recombinase